MADYTNGTLFGWVVRGISRSLGACMAYAFTAISLQVIFAMDFLGYIVPPSWVPLHETMVYWFQVANGWIALSEALAMLGTIISFWAAWMTFKLTVKLIPFVG